MLLLKRFLNPSCLFTCLQNNADRTIQWNDGTTSSNGDYWWSNYPQSNAGYTQMFIELHQNGNHGIFNEPPTRSLTFLYPLCQLWMKHTSHATYCVVVQLIVVLNDCWSSINNSNKYAFNARNASCILQHKYCHNCNIRNANFYCAFCMQV